MVNGDRNTRFNILDRMRYHKVPGFPGYQQTDTFPSIETVLDGRGNTPVITVDTIPGNIWRYSGGGYTVMEKVVEDASGMPLETYMDECILAPMGMETSTFEQLRRPGQVLHRDTENTGGKKGWHPCSRDGEEYVD
jgi:CubicO group peptidase (beta-lactamase class C family)